MSSLRWEKMDQLDKLIKKFDVNMTWNDYLIECATIFHSKFEQFMQKHIISNGVIGKVEKYVIRYELQHCGSIHAQVILWVKKENVESIGKEIIAFVPAILDATTNKFIEPSNSMQNLLYKLMVCKQLHNCHNRCMQKRNNNQCKFGFPYSQHISKNSTLNNVVNRCFPTKCKLCPKELPPYLIKDLGRPFGRIAFSFVPFVYLLTSTCILFTTPHPPPSRFYSSKPNFTKCLFQFPC
jgi:hypothetical protein